MSFALIDLSFFHVFAAGSQVPTSFNTLKRKYYARGSRRQETLMPSSRF
jgi:hypothetical protein